MNDRFWLDSDRRNARVPVAIGEKRTLRLVETADQTKDSQLADQVAENDGAFNLTWDRKTGTQFGLPVTDTADRLASSAQEGSDNNAFAHLFWQPAVDRNYMVAQTCFQPHGRCAVKTRDALDSNMVDYY
jgi:hypothetical protein